MIANLAEYQLGRGELQLPSERLVRLQKGHLLGEKGLTKAGIRMPIARLHEWRAVFEGSEEARHTP